MTASTAPSSPVAGAGRRRPAPARRPPAAPGLPPLGRGGPQPWRWPSLALAALATILYGVAAGRVSADGDSSEFTLVLATLGVPHPTGYPLYTLPGHGFGRLLGVAGVGWPQAAALWSAVAGGLAVGMLHALAARLLVGRGVPRTRASVVALLPAVLFAANPMWTYEATVAEVGAFHLLWLMLALLLGEALARSSGPCSPRTALLAGTVLGAGLAHHLSSLLWSLPLVAVLSPRIVRGGARSWGAFAAGALALPLAGAGFVAWRAADPAAVRWPLLDATPASLLDHLTGAQYRHYLGRFAPSPAQAALLQRHVFPGLALALLGLVLAATGPRRAGASPVLGAMLAGALAQAAFAFSYGVPDPASYFLPVLAAGFACAPVAVIHWPLTARAAGPLKPIAGVWIALLLPGWVGLAAERTRTFARFDERVRRMWASLPDEPGFVVWADDMAHKLREYQLLDGRGRALVVVDPVLLAHPAARARFARAHGFDPFEGLDVPAPARITDASAFADAVAAAMDRATNLPVYRFEPAIPSVRRLVKPPPAR
jgi:hypothetical protein